MNKKYTITTHGDSTARGKVNHDRVAKPRHHQPEITLKERNAR
jgi:hypothetical protein